MTPSQGSSSSQSVALPTVVLIVFPVHITHFSGFPVTKNPGSHAAINETNQQKIPWTEESFGSQKGKLIKINWFCFCNVLCDVTLNAAHRFHMR